MCVQGAAAEPRRPSHDNEILERTPRALVLKRAKLGARRLVQQRQRADLTSALDLADGYIESGRQEADPRFYAYAEAALKPWLVRAEPPAAVRLRLAAIRQFRHDFPGALDELNTLIADGYNDPQVWLLKASVLRVQGRYGPAMDACLRLEKTGDRLVAMTCAVEVQSLGGDGAAALRTLSDEVARASDRRGLAPVAAEVLAWSQGVLAGIAERQGESLLAERWYRASLAVAPDQAYVRLAYADFLLAQGRADDVVRLVEDRQSGDGFLLRLALAKAAQTKNTDNSLTRRVEERFNALRARGERPHLADAARFELNLRRRPRAAYDLALENWRTLREPADALILAQTALATGDSAAARQALRALSRQGLHDKRLSPLQQRLAAMAE